MNIETIATGDEIITGFVVDTNSAWLCQQLLDLGIQVKRRSTVGDKLEDIYRLISERSKIADVIIVNGGLGPTSDDNTTLAAARAAGVELERYEAWLNKITQYYAIQGRQMSETNIKQAMLPRGSEIIDNPIGTACGFKLKINNAVCYFTPGVPSEFKLMVEQKILPELKQLTNSESTSVKRYFVFSVSESKLSEILDRQIWPKNIVLGYRVNFPTIEIKLISNNASEDDINDAEKLLLSFINPYLVAKNELDIPSQISKLTGAVPLQLFDNGTSGMLIEQFATAMPHITAKYFPLPGNADELLEYLKKENCRTIAVGPETQDGYSIAYWNGITGFVQTLKSTSQQPKQRKKMIAFAALDMVRRVLCGLSPFAPYEQLVRTAEISYRKTPNIR